MMLRLFFLLMITMAPSFGLDTGWTKIEKEGRFYVSLAEVAKFYDLPSKEPGVLKSKVVSLQFEEGKRKSRFNGLLCWLIHPVIAGDSGLLISIEDVTRVLDPILRPNKINGQSRFVKVLVDPVRDEKNDPDDQILTLSRKFQEEAVTRLGVEVLLTRGGKKPISPKRIQEMVTAEKGIIFLRISRSVGEKKSLRTRSLTNQGLGRQNANALACGLHWVVIKGLGAPGVKATDEGFGPDPGNDQVRAPGVELKLGEFGETDRELKTTATNLVEGMRLFLKARQIESK